MFREEVTASSFKVDPKAAGSSHVLVPTYQTVRGHIPEGSDLHSPRSDSLRPHLRQFQVGHILNHKYLQS